MGRFSLFFVSFGLWRKYLTWLDLFHFFVYSMFKLLWCNIKGSNFLALNGMSKCLTHICCMLESWIYVKRQSDISKFQTRLRHKLNRINEMFSLVRRKVTLFDNWHQTIFQYFRYILLFNQINETDYMLDAHNDINIL